MWHSCYVVNRVDSSLCKQLNWTQISVGIEGHVFTLTYINLFISEKCLHTCNDDSNTNNNKLPTSAHGFNSPTHEWMKWRNKWMRNLNSWVFDSKFIHLCLTAIHLFTSWVTALSWSGSCWNPQLILVTQENSPPLQDTFTHTFTPRGTAHVSLNKSTICMFLEETKEPGESPHEDGEKLWGSHRNLNPGIQSVTMEINATHCTTLTYYLNKFSEYK